MSITIDRKDVFRMLKEIEKLKFDEKVRARINKFAGATIQKDIKDNITNRKQNENGSSWARWKNSSYRRRQGQRNRSEPNNILLDRATLRNSIQWDADANEMIVGTNVEYAQALNDGTRNIVAREFMYISDEAGDTIEEFIAERIFEG